MAREHTLARKADNGEDSALVRLLAVTQMNET